MSQYIMETAQLQCDKGSMPAQLKVTSQSYVTIEDKLMATEKDNQPNTNIPAFGICSLTRKNCMPQPQQWEKTSDYDCIDDNKNLTQESFCMCNKGGKISFINSGDNDFVSGE